MQMPKRILVPIVSIVIGFLLGSAFMYLVDTAWIDESAKSNRMKLNTMKLQYSNALDVSNALVNNCYDAFYTISKCSTKEGCSFESTIDKLTNLNLERKTLEFKLDQLLGGTEISWSKKSAL